METPHLDVRIYTHLGTWKMKFVIPLCIQENGLHTFVKSWNFTLACSFNRPRHTAILVRLLFTLNSKQILFLMFSTDSCPEEQLINAIIQRNANCPFSSTTEGDNETWSKLHFIHEICNLPLTLVHESNNKSRRSRVGVSLSSNRDDFDLLLEWPFTTSRGEIIQLLPSKKLK
jgi:hypothetical protein